LRVDVEELEVSNDGKLGGPDHCRLEVFTDGVLEMSLRRDLNDQQTWTINSSYLFTERAKVKLWDEDSPGPIDLFGTGVVIEPDPDDLLGTVFIEAQPCQACTVPFTDDHADYRLLYDVTYRLFPKDFDPVLNEISSFEQSTSPGVWPHITKAELTQDIKETVRDPLNVNQAHTPLCGPTAIVYELVARDASFGLRPQKKRYVQLCRQLWETGHILARTIDIKPSDNLRNSPHSEADAISVADWMLIAGLRDVENAFVDIEGDERSTEGDVSGLEGYSFPGAMKTWIFEILGFDEADLELCWSSGEIDTIKKAQAAWTNGGVAFLNIDSNLVDEKPLGEGNFLGAHLPNHWVAFQGGLKLDEGTGMIRFDYYTWGDIKSVSMTQEQFSQYLYDVVLGER
jgi:hypothetical protein